MSLNLTLDEQKLQDLMDKMCNEIYSQLGITNMAMWKDESAVEKEIKAYNAFMQEKLEEESKMRNKQDPVEFVLEENPELDWDDLHDVRTVAELLGGMVEDLEKKVYEPENWLKVSENLDKLEDHYFYLVTHADYGTPMKAKYHDDMGGYFEIMNKKDVPVEYVDPILGESKIKYFMPMPEMPDDYKE